MKHPILTVFKTAPIQMFGMFLCLILMGIVCVASVTYSPTFLLAIIYIFFAFVALALDAEKKCSFISEATKYPTNYVDAKTGEKVYVYPQYVVFAVVIMMIPSLIIGLYIIYSLLGVR